MWAQSRRRLIHVYIVRCTNQLTVIAMNAVEFNTQCTLHTMSIEHNRIIEGLEASPLSQYFSPMLLKILTTTTVRVHCVPKTPLTTKVCSSYRVLRHTVHAMRAHVHVNMLNLLVSCSTIFKRLETILFSCLFMPDRESHWGQNVFYVPSDTRCAALEIESSARIGPYRTIFLCTNAAHCLSLCFVCLQLRRRQYI